MLKKWRWAIGAAGLLILCGGLLLAMLLTAARQAPTFYRRAVQISWTEQCQAGDQLEQKVLELHNDSQQTGRWQATFTAAQINGWLAADLPTKFPEWLPVHFHDPRVAIENRRVHLACRYDGDPLAAVISLELDVSLAAQPDTIAIRIVRARAGLLPLPTSQLLDQVSRAASDAGIPIRWGQRGGDPTVLVPVSWATHQGRQPIRVTLINVGPGEVTVAGKTGGAGSPSRP